MKGRRHVAGVGLVMIACCAALIAGGCGSSGGSQPSAAASRACQEVSGVLANGPDPSADPVGYAEAQMLPLRQVHTSDNELREAIDGLDTAYRQMVSSNGTTAAKRAVAKASIRVNAICPGAAPR